MDINELLSIVKTLLVKPSLGWNQIKEARYTWQQTMGYFLTPLLFLSSLSVTFFMGQQVQQQGISPNQLFFINFAGSALSIYLASYLIAALAPRFEGASSFNLSISLVAFSYTPVYLASVISSIHPFFQIFNLAALVYMIILFLQGMGILLEVPESKRFGFMIVSFILLFSIRIIFSVFFAAIFGVFSLNMEQ